MVVLPGSTNTAGTPGSAQLLIIENNSRLGGKAWHGTDADGIQDPGEIGLGGVQVELYSATNTLLASTSTVDDGTYSFTRPAVVTAINHIVHFIKPNGCIFTSSNVDANGFTGSIGLSPGADNETIDVGLGGHAPIVYDKAVYVEAYDWVTSELELLADGYDPDRDPLTAIIVDQPTQGTLSGGSGVYVYTASSSVTGLDSFTFYLTDGTHNSDVVTVTILSHDETFDPSGFQGSPLLGDALYVGNGGLPN